MNRRQVCVDASLALRWVIPGPYEAEAQALLEKWQREEQTLITPWLFPFEVASAIRKYVQLGPLSQDEGDKVFALAQEFKIELLSPRGLLLEAWELARDFNRPTIYDTSYMALAKRIGCELWTGDERLINAVGGRVAWVKWVGSYTPR